MLRIQQLNIEFSVGATVFELYLDPDGVCMAADGVPDLLSQKDFTRVLELLAGLASSAETWNPAPRRRKVPARLGKPWTAEDDARIAERLAAGADHATLAAEFQRTPGSVRARLVKLGLLPASQAGLRFPVERREPAEVPF